MKFDKIMINNNITIIPTIVIPILDKIKKNGRPQAAPMIVVINDLIEKIYNSLVSPFTFLGTVYVFPIFSTLLIDRISYFYY